MSIESQRKVASSVSSRIVLVPMPAHTLFPVVQVFPDHGKFFYTRHRIAR